MPKKSSVLSQREKRHRVKNGDITLTDDMKKELKALKRRKIDLSDKDAPEITEWQETVTAKFYRPIKSQVTIRLDADVLDWFKHHDKYQSLINKACREYMKQHIHDQ
jgi:uncharacterized protein (DUF4415 family)